VKNYKLIKESWERFLTEQDEPAFMDIGAEIKGKIEDINKQVDKLISGGLIFFDTETMGLDPVKRQYGQTNAGGPKPSDLQETPKKPSTTPAPIVANTTTEGVLGQMLTEIAAAYATAEEILVGKFPSDISHTRIFIEPENKQELASFAKDYYKEGTIEFDPDKYFDAIKGKIRFAIKSNDLYEKVKAKEEPEVFANISDEEFREGVMDPKILRFYGVEEPSVKQIRAFYNEKILPELPKIKTPHQLLMMTAYFGSEEKVMAKIDSGEISIEDLYNLNTDKLQQPDDTIITTEKEAIERFYEFAGSKSGVPLIAQNAGFDKNFISRRAELHGLKNFDSLGLKSVKDTLNLFKSFRNYLEEIVAKANQGKEQIATEITRLSGGTEPSKALDILKSPKGIPSVSQGPMASALKIEATMWHTAIADIKMLFDIFSTVINILKEIAKLDPGASVGNLKQGKKTMKEFRQTEPSQELASYMAGYFDKVIELSNQAIEMIDVFDLAIENGGSQDALAESKHYKKNPITENRKKIRIKFSP
jgi:DNA polymerase III epsilon subunit-like protein